MEISLVPLILPSFLVNNATYIRGVKIYQNLLQALFFALQQAVLLYEVFAVTMKSRSTASEMPCSGFFMVSLHLLTFPENGKNE